MRETETTDTQACQSSSNTDSPLGRLISWGHVEAGAPCKPSASPGRPGKEPGQGPGARVLGLGGLCLSKEQRIDTKKHLRSSVSDWRRDALNSKHRLFGGWTRAFAHGDVACVVVVDVVVLLI